MISFMHCKLGNTVSPVALRGRDGNPCVLSFANAKSIYLTMRHKAAAVGGDDRVALTNAAMAAPCTAAIVTLGNR